MQLTIATQPTATIGSESSNTNFDLNEGQHSDFCATYSPEDNKLRISSVSRFDDATLERVKAAGFRWAPRQQIWVAPMWTPEREDLALELAGEIDDEDKSLAERAADRAERFSDYSSNRAQDAERARSAVAAIAGNIPFGQPILVGHHSERHARKDAEKISNGMRRAVSMWEASEFWQRRASSALAHAKYKELPAVRHRRIKGLEADQRSHERNIAQAEKFMTAWTRDGLNLERAKAIAGYDHCSHCFSLTQYPRELPASQYEGSMSLYSALSDGIINELQAREISMAMHSKVLERAGRWVTHYANRIAYERAMLDEQGGIKADAFDIQPGGRVLIGSEWVVVLKVNKVAGRINSVKTSARYVSVRGIEEVRDYRAPTEEEAAKVQAETKLAPIVNFPGEGFAHLTKEQWDKIPKDYKGTNKRAATAEAGAYRVRSALGVWALPGEKDVKRHQYASVYITDAKRTDPPAAPVVPAPVVAFEREREPSALPAAVQAPAKSQEASDFEAMREQLKQGIQVVSAPQLFPTPSELAARMVDLANLQMGARVLEPSAGTGRILEALPGVSPFPGMRQTALDVVAVEIKQSLADNLKQSGLAGVVKCADFLTCTPEELGSFDACLMNPPFAPAALDIEHIKHAYSMLRVGGVLVAICANGPRQNAQLRPMVEACKGTWEVLPPDTFKESGTGVSTVMLSITR